MKKHTKPLVVDTFYHVYNRGNNGADIFFEDKNYAYFLEKYRLYVSPIADTFAYCLMKNHYHLLIRIKSKEEFIRASNIEGTSVSLFDDLSKTISNQWAKLFNAYTQGMNKVYGRTGSLLEKPFRRKEVKSDAYFSRLIHYIHFNPQHHGFINDFRDYPHSSYHSHLSNKGTQLRRTEVIEWFGNTATYVRFHQNEPSNREIEELISNPKVMITRIDVLLCPNTMLS